jgi:phage shock protein C
MNGNWHNGSQPRRSKLYRNREDGLLAGVCAGFADYFGFDLVMTRVLLVIGAFFFPSLIIVYLVLALVLKSKPPRLGRASAVDDDLERRVRAEPHSTLSNVRHRFRDLDARLQRLEKYVTSKRFGLDREFAELKD